MNAIQEKIDELLKDQSVTIQNVSEFLKIQHVKVRRRRYEPHFHTRLLEK